MAPDSIYGVLHRDCFELFPDAMFADLFTDVGERTGHGWCPSVDKPRAHILILRTTNPAQMAVTMTSQSDGQPRTTARCATPGHPGGSDVRRSSALCTGDALGR